MERVSEINILEFSDQNRKSEKRLTKNGSFRVSVKACASIGIWSTEYSVTTGQALVTRRVANRVLPSLGSTHSYIFPAGANTSALIGWFWAAIRLWTDLLCGRLTSLYVVCSRSNAGFIRDIPVLFAARVGVRVFVHVHGSDIEDLLIRRPVSPLARWLYTRVTLILPSTHLVEPLRQMGIRKLAVCENFYELPLTSTVGAHAKHSLQVLWNSNIMASKGFFTLYSAIEALRSEGMLIDFIVLGSPMGDEEMSKASVEQRLMDIRSSGLTQFIGLVSSEEANAWLDRSDVVALPSRYASECQPMSLIAAMCAGVAIITAERPALRATLRDYPAEYVDAYSAEDIKAALQKIAKKLRRIDQGFQSDSGRECSQSCYARQRFSTERFDKEMTALLSSS